MLRARLTIIILALPFLAGVIAIGGDLFFVGVGLMLGLAALEYARLFRRSGNRPSAWLVVGGVLLLALTRHVWGFEHSGLVLSAVTLIAMAWHILDYEAGAPQSASDYALTLAGVVYLGWMGGYLLSLRALEGGLWWFLLVLPCVWLADSAAYLVGLRFGRRKFSPRVSPGKTWEGYLAGIGVAALGGAGLSALWNLGGAAIRADQAVTLGALLGAITPLGDLGVSMFKRQMQAKDTGSLLPGHGGVLDRIDSWLWGAVIGYYLIAGLFN